MSITAASSAQTTSVNSQIFDFIYKVGSHAGAGALAGHAFGIINPVGGAIFGASKMLASKIIDPIIAKLSGDSTALKIAGWAVSFIASMAAGIFAATAAGFPLTVLGSVGMLITMIAADIAIGMIAGGLGCSAACLGGAGLALKERYC